MLTHTKHLIRSYLVRVVVAFAYAFGSFWVIVATNDMGYTRDESFYFRYAIDYADWMVQADDTDADGLHPNMERHAVHKAWRGNFEHPPLVKVMMGVFWREFARIERPARVVPSPRQTSKAVTPPLKRDVRFKVEGLTPSHPFDMGTKVLILGPQLVSPSTATRRSTRNIRGDLTPGDDRVIAIGEVERRKDRSATIVLKRGSQRPDKTITEEHIREICEQYRAGPEYVRGCSVVRDGPLLEGSAMRLVGPFFTALLIFGMVLFGWSQLHPFVGLSAPLLFLSTPRWFFHAHMAAFDMPVTAMIFLVAAGFWLSLKKPAWAWITAVLWGIALLTKHNALFAVIPLIGFWLFAYRGEFSLDRPAMARSRAIGYGLGLLALLILLTRLHVVWGGLTCFILLIVVTGWRIRFPRIPLSFLVMPPIGITMLFVFWPKLWVDPFRAVETYLNFHLDHDHYLQYYMGRVLQAPPFPMEFPFAMSLLTIPALTVLVGIIGSLDLLIPSMRRAWANARKKPILPPTGLETTRERLALFLFIQALFPVVLIALPTTPIFGGVKHWMTGMPFFCLLGGWGILRLAQSTARLLGTKKKVVTYAVGLIISLCVLGPASYATHRSTRVGNAHYNELAGGISGAADLKLTRIYWGYSSHLAFPYVNKTLAANSRVWFHDTTYDAYHMYRNEGRLRMDLRWANTPFTADATLFEEQKFFARRQLDIQRNYNLAGPSWSWRIEGVPMISVYVRPKTSAFLDYLDDLMPKRSTGKTSTNAPRRPQKPPHEGVRIPPRPRTPIPAREPAGRNTPAAIPSAP
jgi:hypothetical protein